MLDELNGVLLNDDAQIELTEELARKADAEARAKANSGYFSGWLGTAVTVSKSDYMLSVSVAVDVMCVGVIRAISIDRLA